MDQCIHAQNRSYCEKTIKRRSSGSIPRCHTSLSWYLSSELLTCSGGCPATFRCCHSCGRSCSCSRCRGGSAGPCCPLPWGCLHSPQHDLHPTKNQNLTCSVSVARCVRACLAQQDCPLPKPAAIQCLLHIVRVLAKMYSKSNAKVPDEQPSARAPVTSPVLIYALTCIP